MTDILDSAAELENRLRDEAIKYRKPAPKNIGFCHYCSSPTNGCFCSKECCEDYERQERHNEREGK